MILIQYVPAFVSECYVFVIFDCVLGMLNTIVALTLTLKTQKINKTNNKSKPFKSTGCFFEIFTN